MFYPGYIGQSTITTQVSNKYTIFVVVERHRFAPSIVMICPGWVLCIVRPYVILPINELDRG